MATGTYDPFALEKPVLRLGEHGEWTLGDLTDDRQRRAQAVGERFAGLAGDASVADLAALVGELAEAVCDNAAGLGARIVDLADVEKHGDAALGVRALTGLLEFIGEWLGVEADAGNA
jgi:hypothetical protein